MYNSVKKCVFASDTKSIDDFDIVRLEVLDL